MKHWFKKSVSILVIFLFTVNSCFADAGMALNLSPRAETPKFLQIDIPAELASVDDFYEAPAIPNPKMILHIQNAHTNYEAQTKIRDLMTYLNKNYGFKTIFVEGASENLNPDYLKLFPDAETNKKLWDELAKRGQITGADWFLLEEELRSSSSSIPAQAGILDSRLRGNEHAKKHIQGVGIEKAELYRENYEALKAVYSREAETTKFLTGLESELDNLATKILPPETRKVISEWKKFEKGHREFMPFVSNLSKLAKDNLKLDLKALYSQIEWPQLTRLLTLQGMEKQLSQQSRTTYNVKRTSGKDEGRTIYDVRKTAELERQEMLKWLKARGVRKELIQKLELFDEQHINLNTIKASSGKTESFPRFFIEKLIEEAGPKGLKFSDYPNFALYAGYLILKYEIEPSSLFSEIKKLFEKLLDVNRTTYNVQRDDKTIARSTNDDVLIKSQSDLIELFRDAELMRKLLNLELSRDEWKKTILLREQLEPNQLFKRVKGLVNGKAYSVQRDGQSMARSTNDVVQSHYQKQVDIAFDNAFSFYNFATQREDVFFQKIQSELAGTDKAILMTGGFHTDGLKTLFRDHDISYGSLTPRLTEIEKSNLYRDVMLGKADALPTIDHRLSTIDGEQEAEIPRADGSSGVTSGLPRGDASGSSSNVEITNQTTDHRLQTTDSSVEVTSLLLPSETRAAQGAPNFRLELRTALASIGISREEVRRAEQRYEFKSRAEMRGKFNQIKDLLGEGWQDIPTPVSLAVEENKLRDWANAATLPETRIVRNKIVDHLLNSGHVNFENFLRELLIVVEKFNTVLKMASPDKARYAVVFNDLPHKSSRWVYELIKSKLAYPPIIELYSNQENLEEGLGALDRVVSKPDFFVYFDDAIFSGQQIGAIYDRLNQARFRLDLVRSKGERFYTVVPFATEKAITNISQAENITVIHSQSIPTVANVLGEDGGLEGGDAIMLFDHSIPDDLSIPSEVVEVLPRAEKPYLRRTAEYYHAEAKEFLRGYLIRSEARGLGLSGDAGQSFRQEFLELSPGLNTLVQSVDISEESNEHLLAGSFKTAAGDINFKAVREGDRITSLLTVTLNPDLRQKVSQELLRAWFVFFKNRGLKQVDFEFFTPQAGDFLRKVMSGWLNEGAELLSVPKGITVDLGQLDDSKLKEAPTPEFNLEAWPNQDEILADYESSQADADKFYKKRAAQYFKGFPRAIEVLRQIKNDSSITLENIEGKIRAAEILRWGYQSRGNPLYSISVQVGADLAFANYNHPSSRLYIPRAGQQPWGGGSAGNRTNPEPSQSRAIDPIFVDAADQYFELILDAVRRGIQDPLYQLPRFEATKINMGERWFLGLEEGPVASSIYKTAEEILRVVRSLHSNRGEISDAQRPSQMAATLKGAAVLRLNDNLRKVFGGGAPREIKSDEIVLVSDDQNNSPSAMHSVLSGKIILSKGVLSFAEVDVDDIFFHEALHRLYVGFSSHPILNEALTEWLTQRSLNHKTASYQSYVQALESWIDVLANGDAKTKLQIEESLVAAYQEGSVRKLNDVLNSITIGRLPADVALYFLDNIQDQILYRANLSAWVGNAQLTSAIAEKMQLIQKFNRFSIAIMSASANDIAAARSWQEEIKSLNSKIRQIMLGDVSDEGSRFGQNSDSPDSSPVSDSGVRSESRVKTALAAGAGVAIAVGISFGASLLFAIPVAGILLISSIGLALGLPIFFVAVAKQMARLRNGPEASGSTIPLFWAALRQLIQAKLARSLDKPVPPRVLTETRILPEVPDLVSGPRSSVLKSDDRSEMRIFDSRQPTNDQRIKRSEAHQDAGLTSSQSVHLFADSIIKAFQTPGREISFQDLNNFSKWGIPQEAFLPKHADGTPRVFTQAEIQEILGMVREHFQIDLESDSYAKGIMNFFTPEKYWGYAQSGILNSFRAGLPTIDFELQKLERPRLIAVARDGLWAHVVNYFRNRAYYEKPQSLYLSPTLTVFGQLSSGWDGDREDEFSEIIYDRVYKKVKETMVSRFPQMSDHVTVEFREAFIVEFEKQMNAYLERPENTHFKNRLDDFLSAQVENLQLDLSQPVVLFDTRGRGVSPLILLVYMKRRMPELKVTIFLGNALSTFPALDHGWNNQVRPLSEPIWPIRFLEIKNGLPVFVVDSSVVNWKASILEWTLIALLAYNRSIVGKDEEIAAHLLRGEAPMEINEFFRNYFFAEPETSPKVPDSDSGSQSSVLRPDGVRSEMGAPGLRAGPVSQDKKDYVKARLLEAEFIAEDADLLTNTLLRMTPEALDLLVGWNVMLSKQADWIKVYQDSDSSVGTMLFASDGALVQSIRKLMADYGPFLAKHGNGKTAERRKLLLKYLLPAAQMEKYLAQNISESECFELLKSQYALLVNEHAFQAALDFVEGYHAKFASLLNADGHSYAWRFVKLGGVQNIKQRFDQAQEFVKRNKDNFKTRASVDGSTGESLAWKFVLSKGVSKALSIEREINRASSDGAAREAAWKKATTPVRSESRMEMREQGESFILSDLVHDVLDGKYALRGHKDFVVEYENLEQRIKVGQKEVVGAIKYILREVLKNARDEKNYLPINVRFRSSGSNAVLEVQNQLKDPNKSLVAGEGRVLNQLLQRLQGAADQGQLWVDPKYDLLSLKDGTGYRLLSAEEANKKIDSIWKKNPADILFTKHFGREKSYFDFGKEGVGLSLSYQKAKDFGGSLEIVAAENSTIIQLTFPAMSIIPIRARMETAGGVFLKVPGSDSGVLSAMPAGRQEVRRSESRSVDHNLDVLLERTGQLKGYPIDFVFTKTSPRQLEFVWQVVSAYREAVGGIRIRLLYPGSLDPSVLERFRAIEGVELVQDSETAHSRSLAKLVGIDLNQYSFPRIREPVKHLFALWQEDGGDVLKRYKLSEKPIVYANIHEHEDALVARSVRELIVEHGIKTPVVIGPNNIDLTAHTKMLSKLNAIPGVSLLTQSEIQSGKKFEPGKIPVLFLDTMGDLALILHEAKIAVYGNTLFNKGGFKTSHNLAETRSVVISGEFSPIDVSLNTNDLENLKMRGMFLPKRAREDIRRREVSDLSSGAVQAFVKHDAVILVDAEYDGAQEVLGRLLGQTGGLQKRLVRTIVDLEAHPEKITDLAVRNKKAREDLYGGARKDLIKRFSRAVMPAGRQEVRRSESRSWNFNPAPGNTTHVVKVSNLDRWIAPERNKAIPETFSLSVIGAEHVATMDELSSGLVFDIQDEAVLAVMRQSGRDIMFSRNISDSRDLPGLLDQHEKFPENVLYRKDKPGNILPTPQKVIGEMASLKEDPKLLNFNEVIVRQSGAKVAGGFFIVRQSSANSEQHFETFFREVARGNGHKRLRQIIEYLVQNRMPLILVLEPGTTEKDRVAFKRGFMNVYPGFADAGDRLVYSGEVPGSDTRPEGQDTRGEMRSESGSTHVIQTQAPEPVEGAFSFRAEVRSEKWIVPVIGAGLIGWAALQSLRRSEPAQNQPVVTAAFDANAPWNQPAPKNFEELKIYFHDATLWMAKNGFGNEKELEGYAQAVLSAQPSSLGVLMSKRREANGSISIQLNSQYWLNETAVVKTREGFLYRVGSGIIREVRGAAALSAEVVSKNQVMFDGLSILTALNRSSDVSLLALPQARALFNDPRYLRFVENNQSLFSQYAAQKLALELFEHLEQLDYLDKLAKAGVLAPNDLGERHEVTALMRITKENLQELVERYYRQQLKMFFESFRAGNVDYLTLAYLHLFNALAAQNNTADFKLMLTLFDQKPAVLENGRYERLAHELMNLQWPVISAELTELKRLSGSRMEKRTSFSWLPVLLTNGMVSMALWLGAHLLFINSSLMFETMRFLGAIGTLALFQSVALFIVLMSFLVAGTFVFAPIMDRMLSVKTAQERADQLLAELITRNYSETPAIQAAIKKLDRVKISKKYRFIQGDGKGGDEHGSYVEIFPSLVMFFPALARYVILRRALGVAYGDKYFDLREKIKNKNGLLSYFEEYQHSRWRDYSFSTLLRGKHHFAFYVTVYMYLEYAFVASFRGTPSLVASFFKTLFLHGFKALPDMRKVRSLYAKVFVRNQPAGDSDFQFQHTYSEVESKSKRSISNALALATTLGVGVSFVLVIASALEHYWMTNLALPELAPFVNRAIKMYAGISILLWSAAAVGAIDELKVLREVTAPREEARVRSETRNFDQAIAAARAQSVPPLKEGQMLYFTRPYKEYWKLHLSVAPENYQRVHEWLWNHLVGTGIGYKHLFVDNSDDKDFTVYVGSLKDTRRLAEEIQAGIGGYLLIPGYDILSDDMLLSPKAPKVWGRYRIIDHDQTLPNGQKVRFDAYGGYGLSFLEDDHVRMKNIYMHGSPEEKRRLPEFRILAARRAFEVIKQLTQYGDDLTGGAKTFEEFLGSHPIPAEFQLFRQMMTRMSAVESSIELSTAGTARYRPISADEFENLTKDFRPTKDQGTLFNAKEKVYVYVKKQYAINSTYEYMRLLSFLRFCTKIGMFHPATEWGTYIDRQGRYQIFAVTRQLLQKMPTKGGQKLYTRDDFPRSADPVTRTQQDESFPKDLMEHSGSHVFYWRNRLTSRVNLPVPETLFNKHEASQAHNWGWDPKTGLLYPLDIDVLDLNNSAGFSFLVNWEDNSVRSESRIEKLEIENGASPTVPVSTAGNAVASPEKVVRTELRKETKAGFTSISERKSSDVPETGSEVGEPRSELRLGFDLDALSFLQNGSGVEGLMVAAALAGGVFYFGLPNLVQVIKSYAGKILIQHKALVKNNLITKTSHLWVDVYENLTLDNIAAFRKALLNNPQRRLRIAVMKEVSAEVKKRYSDLQKDFGVTRFEIIRFNNVAGKVRAESQEVLLTAPEALMEQVVNALDPNSNIVFVSYSPLNPDEHNARVTASAALDPKNLDAPLAQKVIDQTALGKIRKFNLDGLRSLLRDLAQFFESLKLFASAA